MRDSGDVVRGGPGGVRGSDPCPPNCPPFSTYGRTWDRIRRLCVRSRVHSSSPGCLIAVSLHHSYPSLCTGPTLIPYQIYLRPSHYFQAVAVHLNYPLRGPPWLITGRYCLPSEQYISSVPIACVIYTERRIFIYPPYSRIYHTFLHTRFFGLLSLEDPLERRCIAGQWMYRKETPNTNTSSVNTVQQMTPPAYPAIPPFVKCI